MAGPGQVTARRPADPLSNPLSMDSHLARLLSGALPAPLQDRADSAVAFAPMGRSGKKQHPLKAVIAGGIAGAMEACISFPTEFVKTKMQLFDMGKQSPLQVARDTVKMDGVLGLYRGLSSLLYFSVPKVATRFFAFETLRNNLQDESGKVSTARTLLAGMGAGVAEAIVAVTPMDTIKTKLIHDQLSRAPSERRYKGFAHGVRSIVAQEGLGGIYKGLTATILKQGEGVWAARLRLTPRPRAACRAPPGTRSPSCAQPASRRRLQPGHSLARLHAFQGVLCGARWGCQCAGRAVHHRRLSAGGHGERVWVSGRALWAGVRGGEEGVREWLCLSEGRGGGWGRGGQHRAISAREGPTVRTALPCPRRHAWSTRGTAYSPLPPAPACPPTATPPST